MSNRKRLRNPPPQDPISAYVSALDGAHIPGGCEHCDAYQVINANAHGSRVHMVNVHHDDDCPWLAAMEAKHS